MSSSIFNFDGAPSVFIFNTIDSTSKELVRMVQNGYAAQGDIIIAEEQTEGHGRDGRKWESQAGNLFISFLLEPKIAVKNLSFVGFLLAKNAISVLQELVGNRANVSYKWPNDIMLNNKKMGGILVQSFLDSNVQSCKYLICGMGLNLKYHPSHIESTDLFHEIQLMTDKNKLFYDILQKFDQEYQSCIAKDNMADIVTFLKNNTNFIGKEITVNDGAKKKSGICTDIDKDGNLLLKVCDSIERILSGDIVNIVA